MGLPDVAIGAVVAAFITALVTAIGLIITKENKTSEFRQAWIDSLRGDIAAYISHVLILSGTVRLEGTAVRVWVRAKAVLADLNKSAASIRLRLNPHEKTHVAVSSGLDKIEAEFDLVSKSKKPDMGSLGKSIDAIEKQLLIDAQVLLKDEWIRVKRGERTFIVSKYTAVILMVIAAAYLALNWSRFGELKGATGIAAPPKESNAGVAPATPFFIELLQRTPSGAVATQSKPDIYVELLKLDDLRKKGIIAKAEFEARKTKLLTAD